MRFINPHKLFFGAFAPNWLLRRTEISAGAKLLYAKLAQYGRSGECYPGQERLAEELGVSPRQVRRYVQELEDEGLVLVRHTGNGRTNRYLFPVHPWMELDGAGDDDDTEDPERPARPVRPDRNVLSRQDRNVRPRPDRNVRSHSKDEGTRGRHGAARWVAAAVGPREEAAARRLIAADVDPVAAHALAAAHPPERIDQAIAKGRACARDNLGG